MFGFSRWVLSQCYRFIAVMYGGSDSRIRFDLLLSYDKLFSVSSLTRFVNDFPESMCFLNTYPGPRLPIAYGVTAVVTVVHGGWAERAPAHVRTPNELKRRRRAPENIYLAPWHKTHEITRPVHIVSRARGIGVAVTTCPERRRAFFHSNTDRPPFSRNRRYAVLLFFFSIHTNVLH